MKFSFTRKINLANINRELWPYETEDICISDADSFEEAQQQVDKLVAERIGYYKALSEQAKIKANAPSGSVKTPTPAKPASSPAPVAPANGPAPTDSAPSTTGGAGSQPPPEFQVD